MPNWGCKAKKLRVQLHPCSNVRRTATGLSINILPGERGKYSSSTSETLLEKRSVKQKCVIFSERLEFSSQQPASHAPTAFQFTLAYVNRF